MANRENPHLWTLGCPKPCVLRYGLAGKWRGTPPVETAIDHLSSGDRLGGGGRGVRTRGTELESRDSRNAHTWCLNTQKDVGQKTMRITEIVGSYADREEPEMAWDSSLLRTV